MSSTIRSLFQRLTLGRRYMGRDLQGNKFYEYPPAQPGSTRTKRLVKYARNGDTYSYATGLSRMPAQWTAWLSHTRAHPPTTEELQADIARQQRIRVLAAQIRARDDEEKAHQIAAAKTEESILPPQDTRLNISQQSPSPPDLAPQELRAEAQRRMGGPQDAPAQPESYEGPQAWSPGSLRRGNGGA